VASAPGVRGVAERPPAKGSAVRVARTAAWFGPVALIAPVFALAAADGGYFSETWGWSALAYLWLAGLALIVRSRIRLGVLDFALLGALTALAAWTLLSTAWSASPAQTPLEAQRTLVYVAAVAAVLLVTSRRGLPTLLGGLGLAITLVCGWALLDHLLSPNPAGESLENRLAGPLGYWNALGALSVMGLLLAVGWAARPGNRWIGAAAAAAPVILVPSLYFTFGRAAWLALAAGLGAALLLARERRQLVAAIVILTPAPGVGVWLCSRSEALAASAPSDVSDAAADGRLLALLLFVLIAVAGIAGHVLLPRALALASSLRPTTRLGRTPIALALVTCATLACGAGAVAALVWISDKGYTAFSEPSPSLRGDLRNRVFSVSGSGRAEVWRAAFDDYRDHPLLGSGAGSFEQYWVRHRPTPLDFRDAHSLYLETLAELGPLGIALLAAAVAAIFAGAIRARADPLAAGAFGAVVAYLLQAGVDWDWEMPAVTTAALLCGAALVAMARRERTASIGWQSRVAGLAVVLALAAGALVGWIGNAAMATAIADLDAGDYAAATRNAERASTWAPWAAEPWHLLGEVHLRRGERVEAEKAFREATHRDPNNWVLWAEVARASEGLRRRLALANVARLNPRLPAGGQDP
jgi:tetratricopeptide (TPR) repeat protein